MLFDIEDILLVFSDMQEMVSPDDELSHNIADIGKRNIELNEAELDLISAAGNPDIQKRLDMDENL